MQSILSVKQGKNISQDYIQQKVAYLKSSYVNELFETWPSNFWLNQPQICCRGPKKIFYEISRGGGIECPGGQFWSQIDFSRFSVYLAILWENRQSYRKSVLIHFCREFKGLSNGVVENCPGLQIHVKKQGFRSFFLKKNRPNCRKISFLTKC